MKICKKGCSCVPLPPKESEGVAQKWNIHHVLTGNMFTLKMQTQRIRARAEPRHRDKMTRLTRRAFGRKRNWWQKPCVWDQASTQWQEQKAHLLSLYVSADSLFTLLHMGKFLRQLWGRRRRGDRSFQPVARFARGQQISCLEKLWSPSWTHHRARGSGRRRIPPGCWQGYLHQGGI